MYLGEQVKTLRSRLNLSQERFGRRLGISGKSVSAYETGRCLPNVKLLNQMANEFNVNFMEMSSDNRKFLNDRIKELENCLEQLRTALTQLISTEQNG